MARIFQWLLEQRGFRTYLFRLGHLENIDYTEAYEPLLSAITNEISLVDGVINLRSDKYDASFWTALEQNIAYNLNKELYYVEMRDYKNYYELEDAIEYVNNQVDNLIESYSPLGLNNLVPNEIFPLVSPAKDLLEKDFTENEIMSLLHQTDGKIINALNFLIHNNRVEIDDAEIKEQYEKIMTLHYVYLLDINQDE